MIDLTGVSKIYPVKNGGQVVALDGVNLHVDRGSIHGIVGRSGAGKSTLIRCLTALEKPTEGHIVVDGHDLAALSGKPLRAARRRIGMVFQAANLLDARTAAENIGYPLKLAGIPAAQRRARVEELLALVGLEGRGDSYPSQLSGGQRQQVGIARTLVQDAPLIVLDEPTSALDVANQAKVLRKIRQLRDAGYGVIFTTHNPDHALMLDAIVALLGAHDATEAPVPKDSLVSKDAPAQLLTGRASEVLTSKVLSRTFNTDLTVTYSPELGRSSVHMTSLDI